jgi:lipopolysaccharide/colanic/teichoic acid biosynthesis glycosyltransferase
MASHECRNLKCIEKMYSSVKRFFDFISVLVLAILLSPILLPIFILLRFSGEGEVLYGQDRVGFKQHKFKIWKFATMLKNSPNMGSKDVTLRNDPRVTNFQRAYW